MIHEVFTASLSWSCHRYANQSFSKGFRLNILNKQDSGALKKNGDEIPYRR